MQGFNVNKFVKDSGEYKELNLRQEKTVVADTVDEPKKRGRKKKNEVATTTTAQPIPVPASSMSYVQENIPYASAYNETTQQLDETIAQLNMLGAETVADINVIRGNKTLRNKFNIVNEMTQTATAILNAKLTAIREKNTVINNINRLELDRIKQLKTTASEEDDNTRIANLYSAFISTPIGAGPNVLGPNVQDVMMQTTGLPVVPIGGDQQAWESSLSPADNRMVLEAKGMIETVVVYDQTTGNRWFDVVDKQTRKSVPNVEKPDNSRIYDLDINVRGGFAKDGNLNLSYPLIVINGMDTSITEF